MPNCEKISRCFKCKHHDADMRKATKTCGPCILAGKDNFKPLGREVECPDLFYQSIDNPESPMLASRLNQGLTLKEYQDAIRGW